MLGVVNSIHISNEAPPPAASSRHATIERLESDTELFSVWDVGILHSISTACQTLILSTKTSNTKIRQMTIKHAALTEKDYKK